jgi:hypothetical protein
MDISIPIMQKGHCNTILAEANRAVWRVRQ